MYLDQSQWTLKFSVEAIPSFTCPRCKRGALALHNGAVVEEPAHSKFASKLDGWEPDWTQERFMLALKCGISKCGEIVCVIGETTQEPMDMEEDGYFSYASRLIPKSMYPAPPIIKFPDNMPDEVARELELAFQVYWSDEGSCATKIRTSVERLMDHFGIAKSACVKKKANSSKPGRRVRLTLYDRIERFIKQTGKVIHQDHLHALRVVGNLGIHQNELTRTDLLDAFEVYEHALAELVGKKSTQIAKLAKKLKRK